MCIFTAVYHDAIPMRVLLSQVKIVDPRHHTLSAPCDILIVNGYIDRIADRIDDETAERIELPHAHVSPGWIDLFADFGDPGFERKEDVRSGCAAAAAGGFTEVCLVPNTIPVIQSKAEIDYLLHKSRELPVTIRPLGAISKDLEGKALAELYDLYAHGAVAFSDGWQPVQSAALLLKALEYVRAFDGTIIQLPDHQSLSTMASCTRAFIRYVWACPGSRPSANLFKCKGIWNWPATLHPESILPVYPHDRP